MPYANPSHQIQTPEEPDAYRVYVTRNGGISADFSSIPKSKKFREKLEEAREMYEVIRKATSPFPRR